MKFTIIGPAYPLRGGISHHVYYLTTELTKRGHDVQVVSFRKLYPKLLFPGSTELDLSAAKLDANATRILSSLNPLTWLKAYNAVKAFSPDLAVFQWWHSFFAPVIGTLARALQRVGIHCLLECHNVFPHERSPFDMGLVKFATRPIDAFITHSQKDRDDLLPFAGEKQIAVCPLPVPEHLSAEAVKERDGTTILFFGTIRKYKGLEVLLHALAKASATIDCRLVVAGEFYESIEKYRSLISELGLDSRVTLENRYIANEEIAGIFDKADVLVLPYLSATQSAVARMALANGLPIIASNTGGLAEIVVDNVNGLLFPGGDANALADRIIRYFTNNLGKEFAKNIFATRQGTQGGEIAATLEIFARDAKRFH
ncbi:MAG TPA: glycosyltransferase family 4 protein [Pyrinomonadaceae bacterium]|nr:glycosyltransferase family 4 protein [Pyrinomonadaceae bacterium]